MFPVLNPDGYEYTRSDPRNALVRMWRKSRSPERCAKNRFGKETCCKGVDLNRNFDYRFAETGTSFQPCSEIYHGAGKIIQIQLINTQVNLFGFKVHFLNRKQEMSAMLSLTRI